MAAPLTEHEIAREITPYGVTLPAAALAQLSCYLELFLRWNRRVNLSGLREPREIVRRLFGESLFLARVLELRGWLVDVGSGAGFPGLALKLIAPELRVTLVESRRKKGVFLREVTRGCGFANVNVVVERFESWAEGRGQGKKADLITTRAVAITAPLLHCCARVLAPGGKLVLTTTRKLAPSIQGQAAGWSWQDPIPIPSSEQSVILVGGRHFASIGM